MFCSELLEMMWFVLMIPQQAALPPLPAHPRTLHATRHIQPSAKHTNVTPARLPQPLRPRQPSLVIFRVRPHVARASTMTLGRLGLTLPTVTSPLLHGAVAFSIPWAATVQHVLRQGYFDPEGPSWKIAAAQSLLRSEGPRGANRYAGVGVWEGRCAKRRAYPKFV